MKLIDKTTEYKNSIICSAIDILRFLIENNIEVIDIKELRKHKKIELLKFIDSLEFLFVLNKIIVQEGGVIIVKGNC